MTRRQILQPISWLAVICTILPSVAYLNGALSLDAMKWAMLAATIVWFLVTPLWMGWKSDKDADPGV
jgi:hypothetical protein